MSEEILKNIAAIKAGEVFWESHDPRKKATKQNEKERNSELLLACTRERACALYETPASSTTKKEYSQVNAPPAQLVVGRVLPSMDLRNR